MPVSDGGLELWAAVLSRASGAEPSPELIALLRGASVEECSADTIRLVLPSAHPLDLMNRARALLETSSEQLLGRRPVVDVTAIPPAAAASFQPSAATAQPASASLPSLADFPPPTLNENYTFDNFIIGPSNRLAHAAAVAVSEAPGQAYNPLFFYSSSGMGKTHLLQACCRKILERWPDTHLCYISCEDFQNQFFSAVQAGQIDHFRNLFRQVQILVVDDIHFLASRERTQEEFFHTFNTLYNAHRQIILSSDCPPREIPQIQERLVSRFKWGLVAEIEPPGFETRLEIIRLKSSLRNIELPTAVMEYVAQKVDTSIRELEGTVLKLVGYARLLDTQVDMALAREIVEGSASSGSGARPTSMADIVDAVAEYYGISPSQVQARSRARSVALPRQVCMYLARDLTRYSLESIGSFFGGRDHSTVKHACDKIQELVDSGDEVAAAVRVIKRKLQANL